MPCGGMPHRMRRLRRPRPAAFDAARPAAFDAAASNGRKTRASRHQRDGTRVFQTPGGDGTPIYPVMLEVAQSPDGLARSYSTARAKIAQMTRAKIFPAEVLCL